MKPSLSITKRKGLRDVGHKVQRDAPWDKRTAPN